MKKSKWAFASAVAVCTVGGVAAAQPSATDAELQQYASMYWHLIDTGTPHPDAATFQFADPGMNQPGAYPFAGALALFNNVYSSKINPDATQCNNYKDVIDLITENADVAVKFRVYTTSKEFTTSDADPLVNEKHFWAVIDALGGGNEYTLEGINFVGADLASLGLKLAGAGVAPAAPALTIPENATFEDALNAAVAAIHNSGSAALIDPLALIRGTQSSLATTTELASLLQGAADTYTADPVFVVSGDFAMISLVRVDYGEKVYIADASLGAVFGPYEQTAELPVKDVLVAHPDLYIEGMPVAVISAKSSAACVPLSQVATPPTTIPWPTGPLPPLPSTPGPVPGPIVTTPGWWPNPLPPAAWPAPWACRTIPPTGVSPATCICSQTRKYQRPVLRCFLGFCWTRIQHAVETEVCSTTGPCPPGGPVPGPVWTCTVTHQVFP